MIFNPIPGFITTILMLALFLMALYGLHNKKWDVAITSFFISIFATIIIVTSFSVMFKIVTLSEVFTFSVFGTPLIVGMWMGLWLAGAFDGPDAAAQRSSSRFRQIVWLRSR